MTVVLVVTQLWVAYPLVLAHPPAPPVRGVLQFGEEADSPRTSVYGGYGYIGESEAESYEALKLECRPEDLQQDYREYCGGTTSASSAADTLVDDVMKGLVLKELRRHEAEFRLMQLKALGASDVELPDCLENDPDLQTLLARLPAKVPHWSSVEKLPSSERDLLNRYRIATSPLRSEEMLRALIFSDHLQAAQQKLCGGARLSEALGSQCTSIENNLARLEASFPALLDARGEESRKAIRAGFHELLGAQIDQPLTDESRLSLGAARYESALELTSPLVANSMEIKIADALFDSGQTSTPEPRRTQLNKARDRINAGLSALLKGEAEHHEDALEELCEQDSLNTYIAKEPQIVRQTLMDSGPREKALMRLVLCESPLISRLGRLSSCDKVSLVPGSATAPARVTVNRMEHGYPYGARVNYQIEVPPPLPADQPHVISTELKVRADSNLTDEQISAKIGSMQEQLNAFFGCMSGERSAIQGVSGLADRTPCPPDPRMARPPVRFRIAVVRTPPAPETPPVVRLHACYRAELSSPDNVDCDKARGYALKQCVESIQLWQRAGKIGGSSRYALPMDEFLTSIAAEGPGAGAAGSAPPAEPPPDFLGMSAEQVQDHCEAKNPVATDGRYDRANAANYTLNSPAGTVIHEMAHALGAPDEYQDPSYPFLPQGEHDSIMNAPGQLQASLKPRHLQRFLEPLSCFQGLLEAGAR